MFNEIVYDILKFIEEFDGCSLQDILCTLDKIFDTSDTSIEKDIKDFLDTLINEKIISNVNSYNEQQKESVRDIVYSICSSTEQLMSVCLELTYRCNEKCIHCYIGEQARVSRELNFDKYISIILYLLKWAILKLTGLPITFISENPFLGAFWQECFVV